MPARRSGAASVGRNGARRSRCLGAPSVTIRAPGPRHYRGDRCDRPGCARVAEAGVLSSRGLGPGIGAPDSRPPRLGPGRFAS